MARFADWVDLAGSTVRGLQARDMAGLYEREWPEAMKSLTADHREAIERETGTFHRNVRFFSALMYGLIKRLAPQRRLIFALALILTLASLIEVVADTSSLSISLSLRLLLPFALMTFLLAMELIDKIKYRDELELARDLQKNLVPQTLPEVRGVQLAAFNRVANTVGGDIYDFVPLPDGRLAVLFGDASGHGMAAGLLMAVAHAAFRTQLDMDPKPEAIHQ